MKAKELREKDVTTLQANLRDAIKKLADMRLQHGMEQLKSVHLLRQARKDIARMNTVIAELQRKAAVTE